MENPLMTLDEAKQQLLAEQQAEEQKAKEFQAKYVELCNEYGYEVSAKINLIIVKSK